MKTVLFILMSAFLAAPSFAADCKQAAIDQGIAATQNETANAHCFLPPLIMNTRPDGSYEVSVDCVGENGSAAADIYVKFQGDKCTQPIVTPVPDPLIAKVLATPASSSDGVCGPEKATVRDLQYQLDHLEGNDLHYLDSYEFSLDLAQSKLDLCMSQHSSQTQLKPATSEELKSSQVQTPVIHVSGSAK